MDLGQKKIIKNIDKVIKVVSETNQEALIEMGERGVGYLKYETPVDSGRLRQSMSYTIDKKVYTPLGNNQDNVNRASDKDAVYIGTNVIYGPWVEYMAKNGSAGFFLRAYKATKKVAEQVFKSVYKGAIK